MGYTLYYTDVDGIRSQAFSSLREAQTSYGALPRRLRPAWVCDEDGNVILGVRPEPPD
jgi:hypothetical protein